MTTVRIGFEVLVEANISKNPEMQGGSGGALWAKVCSRQTGDPGGASCGVGMDGTPPGGDLQHIYPMERPAVIPGPFSMVDR